MNIPLVDLKAQYLSIKEEINKAIYDIIDRTRFIGGEPVLRIEKEFSDYCNKKFGIGVSSGTSALYVTLKVIGIKPGDEVITVPNTFIATAEVVTQLGAQVKFVDVREDTALIDIGKIEDAITDKTKAIIPVHLYGQVSDMKPIIEIAERYDLNVIEDCAQAHGAEQNGKKAPLGDVGCFSFYPGKNLGAYGDAGMIVTNDEEIAEKAAMYIDHGRAKGDKYIHSFVGSNYRLDSIQAAILSVKLKYLDEWIEQRRKNAKLYNELLAQIVSVPYEMEINKHVYHLYVIKTSKRDKLKDHLKKQNIDVEIHYPIPLHIQPAYKHFGLGLGTFPITEKLSKSVLSLPMYPELNIDRIKYITENIKSFLK